jgi:hypothetical protein
MFSIYRHHTAMTPLKETWDQADPLLREAILAASRQLNEQLSRDPLEQGESRDDKTRILFSAPLGVLFEVDEARKLVSIVRAWVYQSRLDQRDCWE